MTLSHHATVGDGAFPGGAKPLGLNICCSIDRQGTCVTESYMKKHAFTWACLSYVRFIMAIMRVALVESPCQTAMGEISALEYVLSGARGFLWPCLITPGNKCHRLLRPLRR
jgi:hypothetical protein